ncbi:MAG TPA: tRNA (5-methylaminomethyl-2-thiouridylate)-methyltransferase, partial [Gammaproteobacteria bacterium]|nr:tRNA (5-methylaminomethyl-2-thiouridylate)-methyltransferase [Gammaproteobacteria bacterium]
WLETHGFDFIITGEVVGQRPMSQGKSNLLHISKVSDLNGLLVRPLCAQNLPATYPEKAGWIQRDKMYGFSGRSRKGQIELAKHYNITEYAQPAGGCCFLTDQHYSARLLDLWQSQGMRQYELDDILLLKVGRHLRPAPHFKLIIGREESENYYLQGYQNQFISIEPMSHIGPLALIDGSPNEEEIHLCAQITARFSQGKLADRVTLTVQRPDHSKETLEVTPFPEHEIPGSWYIEKTQALPKHPARKIEATT